MHDSDTEDVLVAEVEPADDRGRVTFLDPAHMTDAEIEDALSFINEGMPES